jgi:ADP-glucose pyrophosphorylase
MPKLSLLVLIQNKEEGLLSIADNREKSLIPVLGGGRMIDYYIDPVLSAHFLQIKILSERDMTGVKDHLVYSYTSSKIRIISDQDLFQSLLNILKLKKDEGLLILRAGGLFLPDWENFYEFLFKLPTGNYS